MNQDLQEQARRYKPRKDGEDSKHDRNCGDILGYFSFTDCHNNYWISSFGKCAWRHNHVCESYVWLSFYFLTCLHTKALILGPCIVFYVGMKLFAILMLLRSIIIQHIRENRTVRSSMNLKKIARNLLATSVVSLAMAMISGVLKHQCVLPHFYPKGLRVRSHIHSCQHKSDSMYTLVRTNTRSQKNSRSYHHGNSGAFRSKRKDRTKVVRKKSKRRCSV